MSHEAQPTHSHRPTPWTSRQWMKYFQRNREHLLEIPWNFGVAFSAEEKRAIGESLREFQLSESSEGKHFIHRATQYCQRTGDREYVGSLRAFIAEEHRHSRDLGRVLDLSGLGRTTHAWPDTVFRWLRRAAGLEMSLVVIVTAEIIAKVCYAALQAATQSPVLRRLCDQILCDELEHVRYQCERLAILRAQMPRWRILGRQLSHRCLFLGTVLAIWHKHGRAFRQGGYTFTLFWQHAWQERNAAAELMDPRNYSFETKSAAATVVEPTETAVAVKV